MTSAQLLQSGALTHEANHRSEWYRAITAQHSMRYCAHSRQLILWRTIWFICRAPHGVRLRMVVVLICAAAANLANGLLLGENYRSIGSSTACFAALGLIPAFSWRSGYFKGAGWKKGLPLFLAPSQCSRLQVSPIKQTRMLWPTSSVSIWFAGRICHPKSRIDRLSLSDQQRAGGFTLILILVSWLAAMP